MYLDPSDAQSTQHSRAPQCVNVRRIWCVRCETEGRWRGGLREYAYECTYVLLHDVCVCVLWVTICAKGASGCPFSHSVILETYSIMK